MQVASSKTAIQNVQFTEKPLTVNYAESQSFKEDEVGFGLLAV